MRRSVKHNHQITMKQTPSYFCSYGYYFDALKHHVTRLLLLFKDAMHSYIGNTDPTMKLFRTWKPKGKMYSLKCNQCGGGFLSSYHLDAPICGACLQKAKSLDSTVEYDKKCITCGRQGVIYRKEYCHSCYFGFGKRQDMQEVK
jgi:ribosomal protein L37E